MRRRSDQKRIPVKNTTLWAAALAAALLFAACCGGSEDAPDGEAGCRFAQPFPYPTGSTYTGMHGNRENSERVPCSGPLFVRRGWSALEGHLIFQPISVAADGRRLYAVATHSEGCKLFAVDLENGAHECLPDEDPDNLTLGVLTSSPEVDEEGFVYVTDGYGAHPDCVVSYAPDGALRWRAPFTGIRAEEPEQYRAPFGVHFTPDGYIATVTVDGIVVLMDRADGAVLAHLDIPAVTGFVSPDPEDLPVENLPPELRDKIESVVGPLTDEDLAYLLGGSSGESGLFSENTIAASAGNQLFVVGGGPSDPEEEMGSLVAIDVAAGRRGPELVFRWAMHIHGGSGTSPSVDPSGTWVVVGDEADRLLCARIDHCNDNTDGDARLDVCAPAWRHQLDAGPMIGSVSIDEQGVVYAWDYSPDPHQADLFAAKEGVGGWSEVLWETCFAPPQGKVNRQWSSTALILDNLVVGTITHLIQTYEVPDFPMPIMWNVKHEIVAVDRFTGDLVWRAPVADDSINSPLLGPDRAIYVPLMGMLDLTSPNPDVIYQGGIVQYLPDPI